MMRRSRTKVAKAGPIPTFLCRNRAEVTRALALIRDSMGITQLDLDELAGFQGGYTSKLECAGAPGPDGGRPSGRWALHESLDQWLEALQVDIVVVPRAPVRGSQP